MTSLFFFFWFPWSFHLFLPSRPCQVCSVPRSCLGTSPPSVHAAAGSHQVAAAGSHQAMPQGLARVPVCRTAQLPFGLCAQVSFLAETAEGRLGVCPSFRARSWDAARKPRVPSFWECGRATPSPAQMCPAPASSTFLVSVSWAWRSEPHLPSRAFPSVFSLSAVIRRLLVSSAALALTPVPVCQLPSNTTSPSSSCEPPSPLIYYLRNPTPARVQLPPFRSHFTPAQLEISSFDFPSLCPAGLLTAFPLTTRRIFLFFGHPSRPSIPAVPRGLLRQPRETHFHTQAPLALPAFGRVGSPAVENGRRNFSQEKWFIILLRENILFSLILLSNGPNHLGCWLFFHRDAQKDHPAAITRNGKCQEKHLKLGNV